MPGVRADRVLVVSLRDLRHAVARLLHMSPPDDEPDDHADERRRRAARKSATLRTCPQCGRAGALSEYDIPDDGTVRRCRWCGYTGEPKP